MLFTFFEGTNHEEDCDAVPVDSEKAHIALISFGHNSTEIEVDTLRGQWRAHCDIYESPTVHTLKVGPKDSVLKKMGVSFRRMVRFGPMPRAGAIAEPFFVQSRDWIEVKAEIFPEEGGGVLRLEKSSFGKFFRILCCRKHEMGDGASPRSYKGIFFKVVLNDEIEARRLYNELGRYVKKGGYEVLYRFPKKTYEEFMKEDKDKLPYNGVLQAIFWPARKARPIFLL